MPSPIDEDEAQASPSAAEAAGSQLSMLTVNDMDIDTVVDLPSIAVDPARSLQLDGVADYSSSAYRRLVLVDSAPDGVIVRKQRQRSGAQSNGSASPVKLGTDTDTGGAEFKRGFSMGYRPDCEKCRMRVTGHMNHFIA